MHFSKNYKLPLFVNNTVSFISAPGLAQGSLNLSSGDVIKLEGIGFTGADWTQLGQDIDGEASSDESGFSVAMNSAGTRVIIGATLNDGNGSNSGHARVYELVGSTWTQLGQDIDGEATSDLSGRSVAMNSAGTRVIIGAPSNDGNGSNSGHARVYDLIGSTWTQVGQDIDGEANGDFSGISVAMNSAGTRVIIGAILNDGNGSDSGHARVYEFDETTWTQVGQDIDGEATDDESGHSVAMNSAGTRVIIGAISNNGTGLFSGHARVYDLIETTWTQVGQDIDGEAADDESGHSVAMNSAGTRVIIGAIFNDGNGSISGHARVYDLIGSTWTQVGQDIDGEAVGDRSGKSVAMNSSGTCVIIGANLNDGNGISSGHARVYDILEIDRISLVSYL